MVHEVQNHYVVENWGKMVEDDHISRFIVSFVDKYFDKLNIRKKKFKGSSKYSVRSMLKVLVYASHEGITDVRKIEDSLKYNIVYKYVSGDITPSYSVINNFQRAYDDVITKYNKMLLKEFEEEELTNYDYQSIDGTYVKANNSRFNVIHKDDLKMLLKYYETGSISDDEIEQLKRPAYKLYKNEPQDVNERIKLIKNLISEINKSKQNTIPINDPESRWMTNKKGNPEPSYCVQFAVDYEAKIITGVVVTDEITDQHTFPEISDKCVENIGKKPKVFIADTAYHNLVTFNHTEKRDYMVLTPTGKQTREIKKKLNPHPYHKDHFKYDNKKDVFICPEGQLLHHKYEYPKYDENGTIIKNIRVYRAEHCPNCPHKEECTPKNNKRTISENATEYQLKMNTLLDQEKYQKISNTRSSTVEPVIGAMKGENIDNLQINSKKRLQETFNILMLGYKPKKKIQHPPKTKKKKTQKPNKPN